MKKYCSKILGIAFLTMVLFSCKIMQAPRFTTIDKIIDLKMGLTYNQVVSKLGSAPYDVLFSQAEGYTLYLYYYKVIERKVVMVNLDKIGNETTGADVYNPKLKNIWLLFDKDEKLESYITTEGRKDGVNQVLMNNTIYTISMDKGKYILLPNSLKTEESIIQTPPEKEKKKK